MCTLGVAHVEGCPWCTFGVVHGGLVLALVVAWLLVPFILCTNCVTAPTKVTRGWVGV